MKYADLYILKENERIDVIGTAVVAGNITGVALEANDPEKIARYKRKLAARFPTIRLIDTGDGPSPGIIMLRYGPGLDG